MPRVTEALAMKIRRQHVARNGQAYLLGLTIPRMAAPVSASVYGLMRANSNASILATARRCRCSHRCDVSDLACCTEAQRRKYSQSWQPASLSGAVD